MFEKMICTIPEDQHVEDSEVGRIPGDQHLKDSEVGYEVSQDSEFILREFIFENFLFFGMFESSSRAVRAFCVDRSP